MKFCLFFLLAVIKLIYNQTVSGKEIFVTVEFSNGTIVQQDLIEYIEEGKIKMSTNCDSKCEEKAIMVLGLTGTGKTTLVNYLNGVPLVCFKDPNTRKWIIDIAPNATSLPCGFTIGHTTASTTVYPAVYTPPDLNFSYVDNPGFQDTRGIAMEIANNYFRRYATEQANNFIFLLLITYQDIGLRGQQFRDTIKRFSEILGIFSEPDVKNLSKSVAIIVTRVENDGDTDEDMKYFISMQLKQILIEEENAGRLTPNEKKVFTEILDNKYVEIFSNPKIEGPVSDKQSKQISSLIQSMRYFKKEDAKFRITMAPTYVPTLLGYTEERYSTIKDNIKALLEKNLTFLVNNGVDKAIVIEEVEHIESILRDVTLKGSKKVNFETFVNNINTNVLDEESKELVLEKTKMLDFFVELLPIEMQDRFSGTKNYLNELHLETTLNDLINFLTKMYKRESSIEYDTLIISSFYIKSSDIAKEIEKSAKVKAIYVYASHAVNFDTSLELQNYESLTIYAQKWNVEKVVNIDLSNTFTHQAYPKGQNGLSEGANGQNGVNGLNGHNSGHFNGLGNKFTNLDKLTFSLEGSQGGSGQNGGDGANGKDGGKCSSPPAVLSNCVYPNCNPWPYRENAITLFFDLGSIPSKAGNGGNGGFGGFGGSPGLAKITKLKYNLTDEFAVIAVIFGKPGRNGINGKGGIGGMSRRDRCTRSLSWQSWRCCKRRCLGTCCDYHTCDSSSWLNDLTNNWIPIKTGSDGITHPERNSVEHKPNEEINSTKNVMLDNKIEQIQKDYSNLDHSFHNYLQKFTRK